MVGGDAYLQDAFIEVPDLSFLIPPYVFEGFMTFVVFAPVELGDAFEELWRRALAACGVHMVSSLSNGK
jgi:hypothetical protein